ncbi:MAG: hypothetical protein ACPG4T_05575 [Nannocystaceae bacterium]
MRGSLVFVALSLTLSGCYDQGAFYEKLTMHQEMFSSTGDVDPPIPTTGTGTGADTDTGEETDDTSTSGTEPTAGEDPIVVSISVSHAEVTTARSVVVTTTAEGANAVELIVRQNQDEQRIDLPVGTHKYEHAVVVDGDIEFEVVAQGTGEPQSATAHLDVWMPPAGTMEQTFGEPGTTAAAIVLRPESGPSFDRPLVVGNNEAGEVVFLGEASPFVAGSPMTVTSATVDDQGDVFVGGSVNGQAVVRKYSNRFLYWEYAIDGVVNDLEATPGGVFVVGAVTEGEGTNAAFWYLTESGGLLGHETWGGMTEDNTPLFSSIHAIILTTDRPVMVGSSEVVFQEDFPIARATVFSLEDSTLTPCFVDDENGQDKVVSTWLGIGMTGDGFATVGFAHVWNESPEIAWARFDDDCSLQDYWIATGPEGRGRAVGSAVLAGEKLIDDQAHAFVSSSSPSWEYVGPPGTALSLIEDRHGYVHVASTVVEGGIETMVLSSFHP